MPLTLQAIASALIYTSQNGKVPIAENTTYHGIEHWES